MKKILIITLVLCGLISEVSASMQDYKKYYDVDLEAPLPDLQRLEAEYEKATRNYYRYYDISWDMGLVFKAEVSNIISSYGTSETRIKAVGEDDLYRQILALPKEYYPYIGPALHSAPGISEKILNMPGIKETKNQFPKIIAPQLADIEDLEFLSPHLYILLMPEMWPENQKPIERIHSRKAKQTKTHYDADFYARILKKIPDQGFGGARRQGQSLPEDNIRTLHPTKDSPLTGADVKAFLNTMDDVVEFGKGENLVKIMHAGVLLDYWEAQNNQALKINILKDIVNPCQRLVLKIKWAGLEQEFFSTVASQAFTPQEWAYTCDKTIKAFRMARMSTAHIAMLNAYKQGTMEAYLQTTDPYWRDTQYATIQSAVELYTAPEEDVFQALKNEKEIADKLVPLGNRLIIAPLLK